MAAASALAPLFCYEDSDGQQHEAYSGQGAKEQTEQAANEATGQDALTGWGVALVDLAGGVEAGRAQKIGGLRLYRRICHRCVLRGAYHIALANHPASKNTMATTINPIASLVLFLMASSDCGSTTRNRL